MAVSKQFDPLFAKYGGLVPVPLLRALSKKESDQNPRDTQGSYWGLLQVGYKNVLPGFNKRHGTSYDRNDLLNPAINVQVATDTLNRIIKAYAKHPSSNLQTDFSNPEFVKLLLAGWNSGYSEASGVGKVATYLEKRGLPVTHANVFKYAAKAGATKYLRSEFDKKRRWQISVANLYYAQPDAHAAITRRKSIKMASVGIWGFLIWGAWQLFEGK